jgi:hypothetical protein
MTEEKGLDPASADKIGEYVKHKGAYPFDDLSAVLLLTVKQAVDPYSISSWRTLR